MSLSFLEDSYLTTTILMNLRGLRPGDRGVFPYGMPAYLAFCTVCFRHLFEK
jgi:hypothetical protein